jgi:exodeoxyribonuclease V alpha subunit
MVGFMTSSPVSTIEGSIERVTFHSEESGFCVLAVSLPKTREPVTVIGTLASVHSGEQIQCRGQWINNPQYGLQFQAQSLQTLQPTSQQGLLKYLSSGLIKGIGPHYAKKLITAFGEKVFDIIENEPQRLHSIPGIGAHRASRITASWTEQKHVHAIMIFLQEHGVGGTRALRIYKKHGADAISLICENPYRLALDIRGIGFKSADKIAQSLGLSLTDPKRANAGMVHVLHSLCEQGHCAIPQQKLLDNGQELLEIPRPILEEALNTQEKEKTIIAQTINEQLCFYPVSLYQAEKGIAKRLMTLQKTACPWKKMHIEEQLPAIEKRFQITLAPSQKTALHTVFQNKICILTGGPGVGKTTLVKTIVAFMQTQNVRIQCASPTGRAAKRLSESAELPAQTLHRLLGWDPNSLRFQHNEKHPFTVDYLIIDEASMIDVVLFYNVLKALPLHAGLLIVGDPDQLPSVGPGAVLADLLNSPHIASVRLTEIFRQAKSSQIILNAHRIHQGKMPLVAERKAQQDFYTLYLDDPILIQERLIQYATKRLPQHFSCDPLRDIQIITPMKKGALGSIALNIALQKKLNGASQPTISRFGWTFAPGDKVIQNINNYDKEVFNGDIGFITEVDSENNTLLIRFDNKDVSYEAHELDEITLAYAISIHKSQGSEFPFVIIPITMQHYALLARNLLYTAMTRGKRLVLLLGQKKAIAIAVNNQKEQKRLTALKEQIDELTNH